MMRGKDPVFELSAMLNAAHQKLVPPWETPSWFKLFRHMDTDGSGKIGWSEFCAMVRGELALGAAELPERRLKAVWLHLDADSSGCAHTRRRRLV